MSHEGGDLSNAETSGYTLYVNGEAVAESI